MATYKTYIDGTYDPPGSLRTHDLGDSVFLYRKHVDFSKQNTAQNDVIKVIQLPAGAMIMSAWLVVKTAANAQGDIDMGHSGDVTRWLEAGQIDVANGIDTATAITWEPEYFAATNTIDIKPTHATGLTSGKVEVYALVVLT